MSGNNSGEGLRNKVQSISCKSVEESQNNYAKWAETYEKVTKNFRFKFTGYDQTHYFSYLYFGLVALEGSTFYLDFST